MAAQRNGEPWQLEELTGALVGIILFLVGAIVGFCACLILK